MSRLLTWAVGVLVALVVGMILFAMFTYTVNEDEQAIRLRLGRIISEEAVGPGLHFKLPIVDTVSTYSSRLLRWDGDPNDLPTADNKFIFVDVTAWWRIDDPIRFYQVLKNQPAAQSRLDDILDGLVRDEISKHTLIEFIRNSDRELPTEIVPGVGEPLAATPVDTGEMPELAMGLRNAIREEIIETAQSILETEQLGIELVGLQFKHVNYTERVRANVFNRMISYQQRIAETYRAEGESSRQQIEGKRVKELQRIRSEAYAEEQEIKGTADAEATAIYAEAYEQDPDFFAFVRTLDTYRSTADEKTTLVFSAESEYYRQLVSPDETRDAPRSRLRAAE